MPSTCMFSASSCDLYAPRVALSGYLSPKAWLCSRPETRIASQQFNLGTLRGWQGSSTYDLTIDGLDRMYEWDVIMAARRC